MDVSEKISVIKNGCLTLFLVLGFQLSGCTAASEPTRPAGTTNAFIRQFIIKFRPHTLPCTADGIARLSSAANARLDYLRPLGDDACVIRQVEDRAADFANSEQRIRQHPAIEWMEQDALMRAF